MHSVPSLKGEVGKTASVKASLALGLYPLISGLYAAIVLQKGCDRTLEQILEKVLIVSLIIRTDERTIEDTLPSFSTKISIWYAYIGVYKQQAV